MIVRRSPDTPDSINAAAASSEHFNLINRLHTDVLEERYGTITAKLLHHDRKYRAAHLVDAKGISRTFAITLFPETGHHGEICGIDAVIKNGAPIGKTFREFGFVVRKNVLDVDIQEIPAWLREDFVTDFSHVKARYSEFVARKGIEQPVVYGVVVEMYHPDFRLPEVRTIDRLQEAPTIASLLLQGITLEEVWKRLETEQPYDRNDARYDAASQQSRREVFNAEQKIQHILRHELK